MHEEGRRGDARVEGRRPMFMSSMDAVRCLDDATEMIQKVGALLAGCFFGSTKASSASTTGQIISFCLCDTDRTWWGYGYIRQVLGEKRVEKCRLAPCGSPYDRSIKARQVCNEVVSLGLLRAM